MTLTFSEEVTQFDIYKFNTAHSGTIQNLNTTDNITWTFEFVPAYEGDVVVGVGGYIPDLAGNPLTDNIELRFKYDATRPAPIFTTTPSGGINQRVYVRISFMEAVTGLDASDIVATNCTVTDFVQESPREYTLTINGTPDTEGNMTVALADDACFDLADNSSLAGIISVPYDVRRPRTSFFRHGDMTVTGNFQVNIIIDENATRLTASQVIVHNGTVIMFGTAVNAYVVTISPDQDGDVYVEMPGNAVFDNAGNGNLSSNITLRYDLNPPTAVINPLYGSPFSGAFPVTVDFSEKVTGFDAGDITVANGTVSDFTVVDDSTFSCTVTPLAEGEVKMSIAAGVCVDEVSRDNLASAEHVVFNDQTAPVPTLTVITLRQPTALLPCLWHSPNRCMDLTMRILPLLMGRFRISNHRIISPIPLR